ncbi:hypothetical protein GCM10028805_58280 [Spirosoma harenae]
MPKYVMLILLSGILSGCFLDHKQVAIQDVSKPTSWTYRLIPGVLVERQFSVLIDGELDTMAALEMQTKLVGFPNKEGTIASTYMKLPKGKFKLYLDADESGEERFIYHPFFAKNGWIKVQMTAVVWDTKDSSRTYISTVPGHGGIKILPKSELW